MGRGKPKIQLNYELIEELAGILCTKAEIASVLKVSVRTLERDEKVTEVYERGLCNGKSCIRREQFKLLQAGNATMAIWLGKQYLGQRDKHELEHSGEIKTNPLKNLTTEELKELINK